MDHQALRLSARELLDGAERELMKAEEDVVDFMLCKQIHQGIERYLISALLEKGVHPGVNWTLADLLAQCQQVDPALRAVNLGHMHCAKFNPSPHYCHSLEQADHCMAEARKLEQLLNA